MKNSERIPTTSFAFLVFLTLSSMPIQAQITLQGGVGIGMAVPAGEYGGSTIDFYQGKQYGLSTGLNLHGKVRIGALGARVTGEASYSRVSNSGNSEPGQGNVEVSQKILSVKLGPEYSFSLPFAPITPYLGGHAAIHIINGEVKFQGVSKVQSGTFKLQSGTRIGLGGTFGVVVGMGPLMSLDLAAHYDAMNLLGRVWEDLNIIDDQRLDSYLAINDEPDPLYIPGNDRHFINSSRTMSAFHFTVTVMFGL